MTQYRTVAAVTAALGQIVHAASTAAVADATVHFARPDSAGVEPKVFIYLYQVMPNAAARNLDLPTRYAEGMARQRPIAALDLSYLVSFVGDDKKLQPQQMLGSVVASLHAHPVLSQQAIRQAQLASSTEPLILDDDTPVVEARLTPVGLSLDELSKVWSVFFQTPYALSVVYRASVALVAANIPVRPPLPARSSSSGSGLALPPLIARVASSAGTYEPITAGSTLVITGKRLRGPVTLVRFADEDVTALEIDDDRITVALPASAEITGIQPVRIVHQDPTSATPARELASNLASFVVHPSVVNVIPSGDLSTLDIIITPAARSGQRVEALLDQIDAGPPRNYTLRSIDGVGDDTTFRFDITGVDTGTYAVRVQVSGVQSGIEINPATGALRHTVTR